MAYNNYYARIKAIEKSNIARLQKHFGTISENSGIYFLTREENGFKYAYIGQAKHLLTRLAQHLSGYQHIDLSLKKHGLYSSENLCGWNLKWEEYPAEQLDEMEQKFILAYANDGYQLRNKTAGGQSDGKFGIDNAKAPKGYRDGLNQGYKNARKDVSGWFEKHLDFKTKSDTPNKNQLKAYEKFKEFIEVKNEQ